MSDALISNPPSVAQTTPFKIGVHRPLLNVIGGLALALTLTGCVNLRTILLTAPATTAACPTPASGVSVLDPTTMVKKAADDAAHHMTNDAAQHTADAVALLKDSFQSVRYETLFVPLVRPTLESPADLVEEASQLAKKARAQYLATTNKTPLAPEFEPRDPIEAAILAKLPGWAGQPNTFLPLNANLKQLKSNADAELNKILNDTFTVLNLTTRNCGPKNKLFSNQASCPGDTTPPSATSDSGQDVTLASINKPEHDTLIGSLETLAGYRAFHLLTLIHAAHLYAMLSKSPLPDLNTLNGEVRLFNVDRFLSTYFDAYFRGGQFIQFSADQKAVADTLSSDLQQKVKAGLSATDTAQVSQFLQAEFTKLCQGPNNSTVCSSALGQTAFVSRAGLSVQFSGISFAVTTTNGLGLSHNYPQLSQFGPQMIRVLVEAVFDANGLSAKAVPNSTACTEKLFPADDCLTATDTTGQATLQEIDKIASTFEALNSMATGVLIRGLNEAALNNEAVSQSIETLIGVIARKITERVLYASSLETSCPVPIPKLKVTKTDNLTSQ